MGINEELQKLHQQQLHHDATKKEITEMQDEYQRKQEALTKREFDINQYESDLRNQKNRYDILQIELQTKERDLQDLGAQVCLDMQNLQNEQENWNEEQKQIYFDNMFKDKRLQFQREMQELNMEKNKVESVKIEQEQMTAVLNSKFEKMENDEKQLNNLKIEVENKLSIMGKKERENQLAI